MREHFHSRESAARMDESLGGKSQKCQETSYQIKANREKDQMLTEKVEIPA